MLEFINDVLVQTILITFFVLAMIMVIEYINVFSQGAANRFMRQHQGMQIIIATVLGLIPGCIGFLYANPYAAKGSDNWRNTRRSCHNVRIHSGFCYQKTQKFVRTRKPF